ncbi:MAG: hypothetical protein ACREQ1_14280 [Woeseiaceae bacterium]
MRQADVKKQFDAAIHNVEATLRDLSDRLEALPGAGKRRSPVVRRARRTLQRTAHNVADHIPFERASHLAADTRRTVTQHPVTTALTAAIAGYCIWSLIRYSNGRKNALQERRRRGNAEDRSEASEDMRRERYPDDPHRSARH